jgi:hypothetical protein
MSTGLPCDQVASRHWPSSCTLPALSSATLPPPSESASAASTLAPPPLVRTARRSPHQRCVWARVSTASNSASSVSTRNMPARRTAASNTVSDPAMAPVCDAAALAPSGARPALTRMTGSSRRRTRRRHELARSLDRLDIRQDGARIRITAQIARGVEHGLLDRASRGTKSASRLRTLSGLPQLARALPAAAGRRSQVRR